MVYHPQSSCRYSVCIGHAEDRKFFRKTVCTGRDEGHMLKNMNSLRAIHTPHENIGMLTNSCVRLVVLSVCTHTVRPRLKTTLQICDTLEVQQFSDL